MKKIIKICLINERMLEVKTDYVFDSEVLNRMNDGQDNIIIGNYIIPKSSINYIKFEEVEDEQ